MSNSAGAHNQTLQELDQQQEKRVSRGIPKSPNDVGMLEEEQSLESDEFELINSSDQEEVMKDEVRSFATSSSEFEEISIDEEAREIGTRDPENIVTSMDKPTEDYSMMTQAANKKQGDRADNELGKNSQSKSSTNIEGFLVMNEKCSKKLSVKEERKSQTCDGKATIVMISKGNCPRNNENLKYSGTDAPLTIIKPEKAEETTAPNRILATNTHSKNNNDEKGVSQSPADQNSRDSAASSSFNTTNDGNKFNDSLFLL